MTSEANARSQLREALRSRPGRTLRALSSVLRGTLLLATLQLLASCANPRLGVFSEPSDAQVHMDGRPAGVAPISLEPAYYGTVLIHVEKQIEEADIAKPREAFFGAKSEKVDFSAPVSPWLFGIDLVGETLVRLFGSMDEDVTLELPLVEPERGDALETMIEESEASSIAR